MVIVNTTFHVHKPLADEFIRWVKEEYAPCAAREDMVAPRLTEIFDGVDPEATSYAFSVTTRNIDEARKWHEGEAASALRSRLSERYGERILFFTTYMKSLPLFQ